jgi:hypothetical protein
VGLFNSNLKFKRTYYEYITWLTFANAGMLQDGNIDSIEYAIRNLPSEHPVIEIGSFCGLSTNVISFYLHKLRRNNQLITCDKWKFEGAENINEQLAGSTITHAQYKEFVRESFLRNLSFFSSERKDKNSTIEVFSDDFFSMWDSHVAVKDVFGKEVILGGKISFAYVDGNHTYDYAKRDFLNVNKNLDLGGFILFDDSSPKFKFNIFPVIKQLLKQKNYEVIIKNPNYLVRKIR